MIISKGTDGHKNPPPKYEPHKRMYYSTSEQPVSEKISGRSRPSAKGGGGSGAVIQTPKQGGGGGGLQKIFFRPFGPHFGLKIRWALAPLTPPLDPPLKIASKIHKLTKHVLKSDVVFPGSIVQEYKIAKNLHSLRKNVSESHTCN